jgi:hypothetical protein
VVDKFSWIKGMEFWWNYSSKILKSLSVLVFIFSLSACGEKAVSQVTPFKAKDNTVISRQISEIAPPKIIQQLSENLEKYQPLVSILEPTPNEILQDDTVTVRLQVKDLPLYKDPKFNLGPHLNVILDKENYTKVYDLNQPLVFSKLTPGTHTLRVFAQRPWNESFKNDGAYAQTTFHVLTPSDDNNPDPKKPLLTFSSPQGVYGAEPILLDFYLANAPLHVFATEDFDDGIGDWRIRCTVNGESFVFDKWQAVYLKGFKPGKNWVKLEFLDGQGNIVKNVFNSTVKLVNYDPQAKDTLSQIVRGEISAEQLRSIIDPTYTAKISEPQLTPIKSSVEEKLPPSLPSSNVDVEKSKIEKSQSSTINNSIEEVKAPTIEKNQSFPIENPITNQQPKTSVELPTIEKNQSLPIENPITNQQPKSSLNLQKIEKNQSLPIENPIINQQPKTSVELPTIEKNKSLPIDIPIKEENIQPSPVTSPTILQEDKKVDSKIDPKVDHEIESRVEKEVLIPQVNKIVKPKAEENNSVEQESKKAENTKLEDRKIEDTKLEDRKSQEKEKSTPPSEDEIEKSQTKKSILNKFSDFLKNIPVPNLPWITTTPQITPTLNSTADTTEAKSKRGNPAVENIISLTQVKEN